MQLLRSGFMVWVFGLREPMGRNYAQLFVWSMHQRRDLDLRRHRRRSAHAPADLGGGRGRGSGRPDRSASGCRWPARRGCRTGRSPGPPRRALPAAADDRLWRVVPAHRGELRERARHSRRRLPPSSSASCSCSRCGRCTSCTTPGRPCARMEQAREDAARLARSAYMYAHAAMIGAVIVHLGRDPPDDRAPARACQHAVSRRSASVVRAST